MTMSVTRHKHKFMISILILGGISLLQGPTRFAAKYEFVTKDSLEQLIRDTDTGGVANLSTKCGEVILGGERWPERCEYITSVAIIIPYRDRAPQLGALLSHLHAHLAEQPLPIHYRLLVVEQTIGAPFNRGKLLNVGALLAMNMGFPCLILHDVDLLPLHTSNMYACADKPRHMSNSIDKFRFNLPYRTLFGGAIAILSKQFTAANGMSNQYYGWGAEDDDFYLRLKAINLEPIRLDPEISTYTMLKHRAEIPSDMKNKLLATAIERHERDGLNSLTYTEKSFKLHPLFTHIIVDI